LNQKAAMFEAFWQIDVKHVNRRPADWCTTDQFGPVPREMLIPVVSSRMEQTCDLTGYGIDPGDVRALMDIIVVAREGEVFGGSRSMVFYGDDMVELEGQDIELLREPAILAGVACAFPDQVPKGVIHEVRRPA
jgi:hypothetical protein